jgi:hypothetical protein
VRARLGAAGPPSPAALHAVRAALRYATGTGLRMAIGEILFSRRYSGLRAPALLARALWARKAGHGGEAARAIEESIAVARAQGAPLHEADALRTAASFVGDRDRARAYQDRARSLTDACGAETYMPVGAEI